MDYQSTTLNLAQTQERYKALVEAKTILDGAASAIATLQTTAAQALSEAQALSGSATVGALTSTDQACNAERTAGQQAVIAAVKTDPTLSEAQAKKMWRAAALASRPADRQWLLCDPDGLLQEYQANLGLADWAAFRAWIVATPVDQMGI